MTALPNPSGERRLPSLETVLLVLLAGFATLLIFLRVNPAVHVLNRDSGIFMYVGHEIAQGGLPYQAAWDHKPPAVFYVNALGLLLTPGSWWGVWAIECLFLFAALVLAIFTMKRLWGTAPALFGAALLLVGFFRSFENGNFTEEYPIPLHFAAVALYLTARLSPARRAGPFWIGVLFALSFLFRANNAMPEAALLLALILERLLSKDWRSLWTQLAWGALGAIIPIAITCIYFWSVGLFQDLLDASILFNVTYSETALTGALPWDEALRAFGWALLLVLVAGYVLAIFQMRQPAARRPLHLFFLLGVPATFILSDPARRTYLHYYMNWVPFLGLMGGLVARFVLGRVSWIARHVRTVSIAALGVAWLAALVLFGWSGAAADVQQAASMFLHRGETGIQAVPPVVEYVDKHTQPGDTVLFWGVQPGMNVLSKREAASAVLFYPFVVPSSVTSELENRFLTELEQNRPALVVDMNDEAALSLDPAERQQQLAEGLGWPYMPANIDQVLAFIHSNYTLATKVTGHAVYALRPSGSGAP